MSLTDDPNDQRAADQPAAAGPVPATQSRDFDQTLIFVAFDVGWLLAIHVVILAVMAVLGGIDQGDLRVFAVFTLFLLPGWWLAPRFCRSGGGLDVRYAIAAVIAFVVHVWLAWPASRFGLAFAHYYVAFVIVCLAALAVRVIDLRQYGLPRYRLRLGQVVVSGALLLLICAAWRVPQSNDVEQFLLQQIDMAEQTNFSPSAIGMTALGIDQAMPRWNANAYHVWFSLMGDVTRLPVEGIVKRWATIPMAVVSLLMLCICVNRYAGRRTAMWVIVLAVIGPVTLWFRSYNAYFYGMRLTNNFCLDKDFAMFWLIPAWLWVFHWCLSKADKKAWLLLFLLTPLCITIHAMTSAYLCLLIPFAVISAAPMNRSGVIRSLLGGGLALAMFLFVFTSGGAQAYHQEIEAIIHHDADVAQETGRSLHHWVGHYATVGWAGLELDTTEWNDGVLRLRPSMLWTCSALLMLPIACVMWGVILIVRRKRFGRDDWRRWSGVAASLVLLWLLFAGSSSFLTQRPHLYRGFERLHWFAFLPAVVAVAGCLSAVCEVLRRDFLRRHSSFRLVGYLATVLLVVHLGEQAWHVSRGQPTSLHRLPLIHSLFDIYAADEPEKTRRVLSRFSLDDGPVPPVPDYLRDTDRVLILHCSERLAFWELRQAVWWPELYGEGYALAVYGESFLEQWQFYYDSVDWSDDPKVDQWIVERGVTIILDDRPGADDYVARLGQRTDRSVTMVAKGVWRLGGSNRPFL